MRAPSARGTILAGLLGVAGGTGAYTFWHAQGLSYLSSDPKACVNCHVMREEFDGWQKASHHGVATCNDCHLPAGGLAKWAAKAENGFLHSLRFTLQDFHEPIRIRPRNRDHLVANCLRCHGELVSGIEEARAHAGGELACLRCHAEVGHGPRR